MPGLLVHKFDGHDHGDEEAWEAHIKIEIRGEGDDQVPFPLVTVSWNGVAPEVVVLAADKDGKIDTRIGPFSDEVITLRITNVRLSGYAYRPALNHESSTLVVVGPD